MKHLIAISIALLAGSALAETSANGQATAGSQAAITAPIGNSINMSPGQVEQKFKTNQASTPGTVIGGVASANGGCPGVEGEQGGVVVANYGQTRVIELRGCMFNQWKDRVAQYYEPPTVDLDGTLIYTWKTKMYLAADCQYPPYRKLLEDSKMYTCPAEVK